MPFNVPSISDIIVVLPCKLKRDQDEESLSLIKLQHTEVVWYSPEKITLI